MSQPKKTTTPVRSRKRKRVNSAIPSATATATAATTTTSNVVSIPSPEVLIPTDDTHPSNVAIEQAQPALPEDNETESVPSVDISVDYGLHSPLPLASNTSSTLGTLLANTQVCN